MVKEQHPIKKLQHFTLCSNIILHGPFSPINISSSPAINPSLENVIIVATKKSSQSQRYKDINSPKPPRSRLLPSNLSLPVK
ncbi:hypothetical protein BDW42DRAFT_55729 [Aspergillus taichungensis]|uniref:Uncharacterized protein n=1 Tax=Aspergillus taichungensis TaxID=482145 RepID=A0A2J5I9E9_9EURO|nr:hypothetical protein BDW42DRAFT_55729 [Aspergillus taichungensis]